jgi:hypothetical protein
MKFIEHIVECPAKQRGTGFYHDGFPVGGRVECPMLHVEQ